ncbi:hypothetical protein HDC90_001095 [Pedobacter sp. AK013]|uniref:hypothetical protein n=1 Tax=Pedobacter sp. AK013 TaxID=2723071 RepID=UPI00161283A6|nr:hypothetical protein [Pedobacter sp. AK013]MBB6236483.1 hypothetical protein [Pedobacter sp. AK013]
MGWKDRLENTEFTITTGDGKVYKPLYQHGEVNVDYNVSVFDFISLKGSFIDRKEVKARSFPLIFWFQGDDNIDQAETFSASANDPRAWTVRHPLYGDITGQPLSLKKSDVNLNVTEINVDFWETITTDTLKKMPSVSSNVLKVKYKLAQISAVDYASKVNLKAADVSMVKENATKLDLKIGSIITSDAYADYQLKKNAMFADIDKMAENPSAAIQSINDVISVPAELSVGISSRVNLLKSLFEDAKTIFSAKNSRNNKAYFEATGAAVLSAFALALVSPIAGDYVTRKQVLYASDSLTSMYNNYVSVIDAAYIDNTDVSNSYSASAQTQINVNDLVFTTVANLGQIAFSAKQERTVYLESDSNLIVQTHKYMGLDSEDKNIETFRTINAIKNKSLFLLKKGRAITYLV